MIITAVALLSLTTFAFGNRYDEALLRCEGWIPERICQGTFQPITSVTVGPKEVSFYDCALSWSAAQEHCRLDGGKLWEPDNRQEYEEVFHAIGYNSATREGPSFLFDCAHKWTGFLNLEDHGKDAHFASTLLNANWLQLDEDNPEDDCVDIYFLGEQWQWGDLPCERELPFICETVKTCTLPCCGKDCQVC